MKPIFVRAKSNVRVHSAAIFWNVCSWGATTLLAFFNDNDVSVWHSCHQSAIWIKSTCRWFFHDYWFLPACDAVFGATVHARDGHTC